MRFTEHYRLGSVEVGEPLNATEDSRRFLTIDRQLLGLFQVFGNGIVEGWNVSLAGGLSVSVSAGRGHINFMSAVTTEPRTVSGLTPNSTNYIYAQAVDETRYSRDVYMFSDVVLYNSTQAILLAAVTTGDASVEDVDTSGRNDISFIDTINTLINQHRHRGGASSPSKVNLQTEVIGQLPGFRIDGIDASKITSGILPASRIPTLDHGDLLHSGILTHAQLDTFVRNLNNPNVRLLGELSTINMLQLYLAMKHVWNEVDSYAPNMIVMIPGITIDSMIDYSATTAVVDRHNHAIQGVPSLGGQLLSVTYRTAYDFNRAAVRANLDVLASAENVDFLRLTRPVSELIVEGFDNVFANDVSIPNWTLTTKSSNDDSSFNSDSAIKVDGAFSAKLKIEQGFQVRTTRAFDAAQDWSGYNEIEASVSALSTTHGQIRFQILGAYDSTTGEYNVIDDFVLLDSGEITTGFKDVIRDVSTLTRTAVWGMRIYTDTSLGWDVTTQAVCNVDRIRLNNTIYFDPNGYIRFRLQTPQKSTWAAVAWDGDLNDGQIKARARSASNFAAMDQGTSVQWSDYTDVSGLSPNIPDNTNVEIELALFSNSEKTSSPYLRRVTLSYITASQDTGLTITTTQDFLRATKISNAIVEDPGTVKINGRIDAGDYLYGNNESIQQIDRLGVPVYGVTGSEFPLSPIQAATATLTSTTRGINGAAAVKKLEDRTYLVADAMNDRVILLDKNGNIIKGLASNNVRFIEAELYPLTCSYLSDSGTMFVCWSRSVSPSSVDLTKFTIKGSGISITLSPSVDSVSQPSGAEGSNATNVLVITLSAAHAGELSAFLASPNIVDSRLFLSVADGAVKDGFNPDNANYAALVGPRGMLIFVGDLRYVGGIHRPISAEITSEGNWLIGNAKPLLTTSSGGDPLTGVSKSDITSVVEFNPDTGELVFSDDSVDFSLLSIGAAIEVDDEHIAVGGIAKDESPPSSTAVANAINKDVVGVVGGGVQDSATAAEALGVTATGITTTGNPLIEGATAELPTPTTAVVPFRTETTDTTSQTDFDVLTSYRGRVKIIHKASGRAVYDQYTSDGSYAADVRLDDNGNMVVVEKTFKDMIGRGRVVKIDEQGNVYFQYGYGQFVSFNDVRLLSTGNMVISS